VLKQDCTNKDEFSSQENTLFKKNGKNWDTTHRKKICRYYRSSTKTKISKKQKKTNKSKIQKSENEEIGKSKYKSTKFAKRLHNTSCIFAALSHSKHAPQFQNETGNRNCHCGSQNA